MSIWNKFIGIWGVSLLMSSQVFSGVLDVGLVESASFAEVKAGTFIMGSPLSELGRWPDEVQHTVTLTQDFQIQKTEVTQLQYYMVTGMNPSLFKSQGNCENEYKEINGTSLCPDNPVESVTWNEVKGFISELNKSNDGYTYRLPTEAEWEYTARAGTETAFNLGDNISPDVVNYDGQYPYNGAFKGIFREQTVAVASLPNTNKFGIYNIHGNVSEWVEDEYAEYTIDSMIKHRDALLCAKRVVRGGSWWEGAVSARSAFRDWRECDERDTHVGFRLVRVPN